MNGFTTVEVILAILLLLILFSLSIPSFVSMMDGNALREDVGLVLSAFEAAKERAIIENRSYSVVLSGGQGDRHIEIASGGIPYSRVSLSKDISHSPEDVELVFRDDGSISPSAERISFETKKGRSLVVIVDEPKGEIRTVGADQQR